MTGSLDDNNQLSTVFRERNGVDSSWGIRPAEEGVGRYITTSTGVSTLIENGRLGVFPYTAHKGVYFVIPPYLPAS